MWSLGLRRKSGDLNAQEQILVEELANLIRDGRAEIIGIIRQKLLSGIRTGAQFEKLREAIGAFKDEPFDTADHEAAAKASNNCRARGIATSAVDMLICAVALRRGVSIFTTDPDFEKYAGVLSCRLHKSP